MWASPPGGGAFLTGNNGLQNGGNPISPVSLFREPGDTVSLGNSDVALLDAYDDYFADAPFAGTSPAVSSPNSNPAGPFPRRPLTVAGTEVGAEPTPGETDTAKIEGADSSTATGTVNYSL